MFSADDYGDEVARILKHAGGGERPMPLVRTAGRENSLNWVAADLFPAAPEPTAALAGLHLYLGNWNEAHAEADSGQQASSYYWHAIVHRQEPDAGNSAYWFRMTGRHPIFPSLCEQAARLGYDAGTQWNPFRFIDYCAAALPGSEQERLAMQVQLAEWQLLFDYCARGRAS